MANEKLTSNSSTSPAHVSSAESARQTDLSSMNIRPSDQKTANASATHGNFTDATSNVSAIMSSKTTGPAKLEFQKSFWKEATIVWLICISNWDWKKVYWKSSYLSELFDNGFVLNHVTFFYAISLGDCMNMGWDSMAMFVWKFLYAFLTFDSSQRKNSAHFYGLQNVRHGCVA